MLNQFSIIIHDSILTEIKSIFKYIQSKINQNNKILFYVIRKFLRTQRLIVPDINFFQYIKYSDLLPKTITVCKIIKKRNNFYIKIINSNNEFIRKLYIYVMNQSQIGDNTHITRYIYI